MSLWKEALPIGKSLLSQRSKGWGTHVLLTNILHWTAKAKQSTRNKRVSILLRTTTNSTKKVLVSIRLQM
ncbi:hypothetical protein OPV22_008721 [Ensete ventricosum]|uniref:Uncharacterized protein n=1 Tax=Ensete ventricosum TaxID=4639 RepID=A0AAV8R931_ENSVE|nr:hypothetical protein OPV22_008721 [Ensete ventricosum]